MDDDGTPAACYEVPRAKALPDGTTHRACTLADAKKLKLLGSFTTAWRIRANPGLDKWKQGNAIMAALTSPMREPYEKGIISEDAFLESVLTDAEAEGKGAADTGTEIHAAIEQALLGESFDERWGVHVAHTLDALSQLAPLGQWRGEIVFARPELGYGGKIDAAAPLWLVDFKTLKPWDKPPRAYDSWAPQLAAYAQGLDRMYGSSGQWANICISRGEDAAVHIIHYTDAERAAAFEEWKLTRRLWLHTSGLGAVLGVHQ